MNYKCAVCCASGVQFQCGNDCKTLYCSDECADVHWNIHHALCIAMKRPRDGSDIVLEFSALSQDEKEDYVIKMISELNEFVVEDEEQREAEHKWLEMSGMSTDNLIERITNYDFDGDTSNTFAEMIGKITQTEFEEVIDHFKSKGLVITKSLILKAWRQLDDLYAETLESMHLGNDLGMIEYFYQYVPKETTDGYNAKILELKDIEPKTFALLIKWKNKQYEKINKAAYAHGIIWEYDKIKSKFMRIAYKLQRLILRPHFWPKRSKQMTVFRAYKEDPVMDSLNDARGYSFESISDRFAAGERNIVLTFDGFVATSLRQPPENFVGQTCCLMIIYVSEEVPAILIDEGTGVVDEDECLLPAGVSLILRDVGTIIAYNRTMKTAVFDVYDYNRVVLQ